MRLQEYYRQLGELIEQGFGNIDIPYTHVEYIKKLQQENDFQEVRRLLNDDLRKTFERFSEKLTTTLEEEEKRLYLQRWADDMVRNIDPDAVEPDIYNTFLIQLLVVGDNDGETYSEECLKKCAEDIRTFPVKIIHYIDPRVMNAEKNYSLEKRICGYVTELEYKDSILFCYFHVTREWLGNLLRLIHRNNESFDKYFKIELDAIGIKDCNNVVQRIDSITSAIIVQAETTESKIQ